MKNQMNQQSNQQPNDRFQKVNDIILNNEKFFVAINGDSFDSVAAGTGLANLLQSLEKEVDLYSLNPINPENFTQLNGIEKFSTNLKQEDQKLEIIFNCPIEDVEKVSQSERADKLCLIVDFKKSAKEVSPADVEIKRPDPIYPAGFILDANLPNEKSLTGQGEWVWLARQKINKDWAKVSVNEPKATLSESLVGLVSRGDFQIPVKSAANFYLGIKQGTNNFDQADSIALETAAYCLRIKEKEQKEAVSKPIAEPTIGEVEAKEGKGISEWQKPPVFTGATTPKQ